MANFLVGDRHEQEMHPDDKRAAPRAAADAWDEANAVELKEVARLRREAILRWRFTKSPEEVARMRTMRRNMERRINRY